MGFFSRLFGKKEEITPPTAAEIAEAGACPNCWGTQYYDDKYIAYRKDHTKANLTHEQQKAFVAQFVETHVDGIKLLRKEDRTYCPKCNSSVNG